MKAFNQCYTLLMLVCYCTGLYRPQRYISGFHISWFNDCRISSRVLRKYAKSRRKLTGSFNFRIKSKFCNNRKTRETRKGGGGGRKHTKQREKKGILTQRIVSPLKSRERGKRRQSLSLRCQRQRKEFLKHRPLLEANLNLGMFIPLKNSYRYVGNYLMPLYA